MRTTVELTAEQHQALTAMASRRNMRGFSSLVQEAVDAYLTAHSGETIDALLSLEGSVTDDDADEMRTRIADLWAGTWRVSA